MKTLSTEIKINASKESVWNILMDFDNYNSWNPFIKQITGSKTPGEKLEISLDTGKQTMIIKPNITEHIPQKRFAWLGHLGIKGLFDGNHIFEIEPINESTIRFIHKENFKGILVGILWLMIGKSTQNGFEAMNKALKEKAEG